MFVSARKAGMSEAMKVFSGVRPMMSGEPLLAA